MKIRESIDIAADAVTVWPFVADPALHGLWNPKVVSVKRQTTGPVRSRERFEMVYSMSGQERLSRVEAVTCEPTQRVLFEHRMSWKGGEQIAREGYQIIDCPRGVRLTQTIDLNLMGVAWPLRLLGWFLQRFGKSEGESALEALKRVVEPVQVSPVSKVHINNPGVYPKWKACVVLFALGLILLFFGVKGWVADRESRNWPSTPGILRTVQLEESMDGDKYAEIVYDYQVGGVSHSFSRISYAGAERVASRYPRGKSVTVFYDPENDKVATLRPGVTDPTVAALVAGMGFLLWGTLPILFFLIRNRYGKNNEV